MTKDYYHQFLSGSNPGAMKEYDLPELFFPLAPRKLFLAGITVNMGEICFTAIIT
jgi:hypothetical protein